MSHGISLSSCRCFNSFLDGDDFLGFLERREQSKRDGFIIVVRVVECQHGGPFLRLTWDPRITRVCSSTVEVEGACVGLLEFTLVHQNDYFKEKFSKDLFELTQFFIALLIGGFQEVSYVDTLYDIQVIVGLFGYCLKM